MRMCGLLFLVLKIESLDDTTIPKQSHHAKLLSCYRQ